MSFSNTSARGPGQRFRATSMASCSSPRLIPGSDSAIDGTSDVQYGSYRETRHYSMNPATAASLKDPTRSFISRSLAGPAAPIDNTQNARVREVTAELASFALSERASIHSASPPRRRRSQSQLDSYFSPVESETPSHRDSEVQRQEAIQEVSEPVSPENGTSPQSPSASNLADMLRKSPPSRSPPSHAGEGGAKHGQEDASDDDEDDGGMEQGRLIMTSNGLRIDVSERTPLIPKSSRFESTHPDWIAQEDVEDLHQKKQPSWPKLRSVLSWPRESGQEFVKIVVNPKRWDGRKVWQYAVIAPALTFPAVALGLQLTILDALSYGTILFPMGEEIFEGLGPVGISMFYMSTVISQFVYSGGVSKFGNAVGSEMIEVVPFFHKMAFTILATVGRENPKAVLATTITAYAMSSVLTGIVFFLMGLLRFGYIVGFIPRQLLIGCIGGVGWFLIATGFEVSARLEGNLNYDLPTLKIMFQLDTVFHWAIPLALAIVYRVSKATIKTSRYFLSIFMFAIPIIFYFFVLALNPLDTQNLRSTGWIFEGPESDEKWWYFYTLYDFKLVHWDAIWETVPAMLALTFFGILHVPINIPALALEYKEDNLNLDRELMAHGVSNALSGLAGSIQNYMVYSNSLLFTRAGAEGRLSGLMLAVATLVMMVQGGFIIAYIPVMLVGTLIFILGIELLEEAVWDTRKKLSPLEYLTVIVITVTMGMYDFVVGIFVGIVLSALLLVVQTSRVPAIRASYSGEVAGSTVRRNPTQSRYLRAVGQQIHVTKLAGYLFFGTIVSVEDRLRSLLDDESFNERPIRFLILDLYHVTGIDYSAAEAFSRISRIFDVKNVSLYVSGVDPEGPLGASLLSVGLFSQDDIEVKMFHDLNSALESCENELLKTLYTSRDSRSVRNGTTNVDVPKRQERRPSYSIDTQFSSPRFNHLQKSAVTALESQPAESRYHNFAEPLKLILQTFQGLTEKNEDFWFRVIPFFEKKLYSQGTILFNSGESAKGFYLLEEGILRADYELPQGRYFESIVAGTTCGELPFFSETDRTATVQAERDCTTWLLSRKNWLKLQPDAPDVAQEMLRISLKLTSERMSAITSYVLTTAG